MGMGGLGSVLGYADALAEAGGPTSYTLIGTVFKIKPSDGPAVTDIPIPAALEGAGHKGHTPGGEDTSSITFNLPYAAGIRATLESVRRLAKRWMLLFPDGACDLFPGYFSKVSVEEIDADSLMTLAAEIVVTGKPTAGQNLDADSAAFTQALAAGMATVDLTNLPGDVDGTGTPLLRLSIRNDGTAAMQLSSPGNLMSEHGYEWLSDTAYGPVTIAAGQTLVVEGDALSGLVDSDHRLLFLSGTGTDSSTWQVTFGVVA